MPVRKDCTGELVERRSHRGATFYGCSRYPDCKFIANKLPVANANEMSYEVQANMNIMTKYLDKFFTYLEVEKNYSSHTTLNYRIDLEEFVEIFR